AKGKGSPPLAAMQSASGIRSAYSATRRSLNRNPQPPLLPNSAQVDAGLRSSSTKLCTSRDGAAVNRLTPIVTKKPTGTANKAAKSRETPHQFATALAVPSHVTKIVSLAAGSAR